MEELTIEQKAQRYDEALKRARNTIEVNQIIPDIVECVESLFPELKESEDEKIRKHLISYFKSQIEARRDDSQEVLCTYNKWIAWLEKQSQTFTKKDVDDAYLKGICDAKQELEKQGEQKPVSKVKPKFRIGDVIEVKPMRCQGKIFTGKANKIIDITEESYIFDDGKAYSIELQDGWKLSEQKPAWCEEDNKMSRFIGNAITADDASIYLKSKGIQIIDAHVWLEELKDRVQSKQEWSKEDKYNHNIILALLNNECVGCADKRIAIEWFKSITPQSHSRNQIKNNLMR